MLKFCYIYAAMSQESLQDWEKRLRDFCDKVPLNDRDGPPCIKEIREAVASQWARAIECGRIHGYESPILNDRFTEIRTILNGLMQEYAQTIVFAPHPDLKAYGSKTTDSTTDVPATEPSTPSGSSVASSAASAEQIPFDVKFLQVGSDVWTVLQVPWVTILSSIPLLQKSWNQVIYKYDT